MRLVSTSAKLLTAACLLSCAASDPRTSERAPAWIEVYGHADIGSEVAVVEAPAEPLWRPQAPLPAGHPHHAEGANLVVDALVAADGRIAHFRRLRGTSARQEDEAYLRKLLLEWSLEPARLAGKPVNSRLSLAVFAPPGA